MEYNICLTKTRIIILIKCHGTGAHLIITQPITIIITNEDHQTKVERWDIHVIVILVVRDNNAHVF